MGQYFGKSADDRALELIFGEGKSEKKALEIMRKENYDLTLEQVSQMAEIGHSQIRTKAEAEKKKKYLVDSELRLKELVEKLAENIEEKISMEVDLNVDPKFREDKIPWVKEARELLKLIYQIRGDLQKSATHIQNNGVMIQNSNVLTMFRDAQERWFSDSNAVLEDGRIVFQEPTPEMLENFQRWSKKPKTPIIVDIEGQ